MSEVVKPKWGEIYVHYQNKKEYKPIYPCKLQQQDGTWVDGVVYHGHGNATLWFVRTLDEFNEKFKIKS